MIKLIFKNDYLTLRLQNEKSKTEIKLRLKLILHLAVQTEEPLACQYIEKLLLSFDFVSEISCRCSKQ